MTNYIQQLSRHERSPSLAAQWCQWLAVFSIPFLIIVVLGHRLRAIDTLPTFWLLGVAVVILVAALVTGARGFFELWEFGHEAGLNSARGMALAMLLLAPFLYHGVRAFSLPQLYDISTDLEDPPAYETALDDRSDDMNAILDPAGASKRLQLEAYPRVAARRYPLDAARVFKEVVGLINDRDWTVLTAETEQGEARIDEEGSALVAKSNIDSRGIPLRLPIPNSRPAQGSTTPATSAVPAFEAQEVSPVGRIVEENDTEQEIRTVEAVAISFLFEFESDVIIRMVEEEDGTLVDMRSVSRWRPHDLGSNAEQIITFLADLDLTLQGLGQ